MALSGQQDINIGLPNESTGSDSLYAAFNKAQNNFTNLFALSSSFTSFTGNTGIQVAYGNSNTVVNILNTGVTSLTAGDDSITLTSSNGNVVITASSGGNGGGVSNVNVIGASSNARITSTGGPIISSGVITIDLANSGALAGTYSYPTMTVDQYGRVTSIANAASVGTVTSVGVVTSGLGIQVSGGPITTAGNITVINTGVTRLSAGTGINLSGSNGNVTISTTTTGGTVTSVGVSSSSLVVTGSPVTTTGTMTVELPANVNVTGNITGGNINIPDGRANVTGTANTVGGGATVGVRSILSIDSTFGSNSSADPASAQAVRGRVTGANLTKTRNYVTGVTGQYLITGTNASEFIKAGVLGVVGDQTTTADGAVVAYLDGDGGLTTANAAYAVSMKNSTPGSGFDYGLDLQFIDLNIAGTTAPFKQADIRFNNGVELVANVSNTISIDANLTVTGTTSTSVLSLNSSENLASGAAANLSVTASYFTTSTASTATLAAGTTGQIKTFMMVADGGDMVITVSNAGWKSSGTGTITFNDIGDGCTLQYINSKWFCVGQNGVVFG